MTDLLDRHDVLLADLDGTLYTRPGRGARARSRRCATPPSGACARPTSPTTPRAARPTSPTTSPSWASRRPPTTSWPARRPAAALLAEQLPAGRPGAGRRHRRPRGREVTARRAARDRPRADDAVAVVQGHSPDTGWRLLAEATVALRAGAVWVACNLDPTLPTERGPLPGNGSMVAALRTATGREPQVAGKPAPALLLDAVRRTGARAALMIGDRLDTDVEGGRAAGAGHPAGAHRGLRRRPSCSPPRRRGDPTTSAPTWAPSRRPVDELAPGPRPGWRVRTTGPGDADAWPRPAATTRSTRCARCAPRTGPPVAARCGSAADGADAGTRAARASVSTGPAPARLPWRLPTPHRERTDDRPPAGPTRTCDPAPTPQRDRVRHAPWPRSTGCPSARSPSTSRSSRTCTPR